MKETLRRTSECQRGLRLLRSEVQFSRIHYDARENWKKIAQLQSKNKVWPISIYEQENVKGKLRIVYRDGKEVNRHTSKNPPLTS